MMWQCLRCMGLRRMRDGKGWVSRHCPSMSVIGDVSATRGRGAMVRSIGADHVIDYTQEDFTKRGQSYDLMLDCIGNHSLSACRRVLNPSGIYVPVGGTTDVWMIRPLASSVSALVLSWFVRHKLIAFFMAKPSKEDLNTLGELIKIGKVTPVIDRRYGLSEVAEAIRYLEEGHARGKVLIIL
jgi:NADPH:quinone reductase-like Zn-dependent oxidoreductase